MLIMSRQWTNARRYNKQYFKDFKDETAIGLKSNTFTDKPSSSSESEAQKASPSINLRLSYTVKRITYKYRIVTGIEYIWVPCSIWFAQESIVATFTLIPYILCYNEKRCDFCKSSIVKTRK